MNILYYPLFVAIGSFLITCKYSLFQNPFLLSHISVSRFPYDIDIDSVSDQEIQDILLTVNLTPRKCLGFKTPFQAILAELGKDVQIRFS